MDKILVIFKPKPARSGSGQFKVVDQSRREESLNQPRPPKPSDLAPKKPHLPYREPRNKQWIMRAEQSLCCDPIEDTETRKWKTYWDPDSEEVREVRKWFDDLPDILWLDHVERISSYLDRALLGTIEPNEEGEPIKATSVSAYIFEFRWRLTDPSENEMHLRQYHGESTHTNGVVDYLVRSHIHFKYDRGEISATEAQHKSILYALTRFDNGQANNWSPETDDTWIRLP